MVIDLEPGKWNDINACPTARVNSWIDNGPFCDSEPPTYLPTYLGEHVLSTGV